MARMTEEEKARRKAERLEAYRKLISEHTYTDDMRLTYEEYRAGAPCPGCGMPLVDQERWEFHGTMHMDDQERARQDAEEVAYRARHPDCKAGRWSMQYSITEHCIRCCPPPPLSPMQRDKINAIFASAARAEVARTASIAASAKALAIKGTSHTERVQALERHIRKLTKGTSDTT